MKLADIHENMLDNAGKWLRAKLQTWGNDLGDERLRTLVLQASKIEGSILQDSNESKLWWDALLKHYSIPTDRREECVLQAIASVKRRAAELLSDDPATYVHHGHNVRKRHMGVRTPHIDWHDLFAHIARDHRRIREGKWSDDHKSAAIYELVAVLAIKEVAKYAKHLPAQPGPRQPDEKEIEALQIAETLWNYTHYHAVKPGSKLNRPLIQELINKLKNLGYKIRWQGNQTKEYPNGDQKPTVVPYR